MTIKIRFSQQDEINPTIWYFQIYGPDTIDGSVRITTLARTLNAGETPEDWLAANTTEAQVAIDAGQSGSAFAVLQEAKQFLQDNPGAKSILDLGPIDLETAITNRTANQETLLLKTLSYAVRVWFAERQ